MSSYLDLMTRVLGLDDKAILCYTRMHSSRMRTSRLLPVSPWSRGCTWSGGCTWSRVCVPGPGGVPGLGGVPGPGWGVYLPRYSPLWTEWQTGAKILPCPKLRLREVIVMGYIKRIWISYQIHFYLYLKYSMFVQMCLEWFTFPIFEYKIKPIQIQIQKQAVSRSTKKRNNIFIPETKSLLLKLQNEK